MQDRPLIDRAIPKGRYQIGSQVASLLGEIESGDARRFRHILAFVPAGSQEPVLYVCAEEVPPPERRDGAYRLSLISELMSDLVDTSDHWGDRDRFVEQALKLGVQVLGLQDQPVIRLF